eukprot:1100400-Prorocentrum_minimum.AAC.1
MPTLGYTNTSLAYSGLYKRGPSLLWVIQTRAYSGLYKHGPSLLWVIRTRPYSGLCKHGPTLGYKHGLLLWLVTTPPRDLSPSNELRTVSLLVASPPSQSSQRRCMFRRRLPARSSRPGLVRADGGVQLAEVALYVPKQIALVYEHGIQTHPVVTNGCTAGILYTMSDMVAQTQQARFERAFCDGDEPSECEKEFR